MIPGARAAAPGFALEPPRPRHATRPGGAVVVAGVADLRREPDAASELVSQLLFGEPLAVLDRSPDGRFLRVSGPDEYPGWARALVLATGPPEAIEAWSRASTLRVTRPWLWRDAGGGPLPFLARLAPAPDGSDGARGPLGTLRFRPRARLGRGIAPRGGPRASWRRRVQPFLGVPYLWGGRTPAGLDCSGFVQLVAAANGVELPRDARDQCRVLGGPGGLRALPGGPPLRPRPGPGPGPRTRGRTGRPRPGDLLFFGPASGEITHVALSAGGLGAWHAYGWVRAVSLVPGAPDSEPELSDNFLGWNRLEQSSSESA